MRATRDKRELTERNQRMFSMRRAGMTLCEIAAVFGISEVRVHVIVNRERDRQELEVPHKYSLGLT